MAQRLSEACGWRCTFSSTEARWAVFSAALDYLLDTQAFSGYGKPPCEFCWELWQWRWQPSLSIWGTVKDGWDYTVFGVLALIALILSSRAKKFSGVL